jgi:hypothetical protein
MGDPVAVVVELLGEVSRIIEDFRRLFTNVMELRFHLTLICYPSWETLLKGFFEERTQQFL